MGRMKDLAIDLMSFEADELEIDEVVDLFATLIRSGMAWTLQGSYGRTAQALIDEGIVSPGGEVLVELIPA
ncbi:hypothetical protein SEA_JANUS_69 [Streptomyces phage Janus]|uniref:DUF7417 domain-containing protein n=1 Tax=Streptomyces phage Janus TaxID=2510525 RepID=A0A411CQI3_9CAUD|nr:hypothetical protein KGG75_gp69 [Streptomyces phage Janus]QAY15973.1 hypothetical protein SEA_JANUS_69 [Streptomyces phage Janus]